MIQLQIECTRSRKKDYISSKDIAHVRQQYRTRFGLQNFAGKYSNDNRFAKTNVQLYWKQIGVQVLAALNPVDPLHNCDV